ncbi:hypothetical protein cypCar_00047270, partial [Cyprinus carpio]
HQLKETQKSFQQRIQQREKDLQQLREDVESHKHSAQIAVEDSERIFTELIRSIEKSRSELIRLIRNQEKQAVTQAEGRLERLEQEINDLRRRDAELEQLSHTQDHIQFLQSFQSLSAPPESTDVNDDPFSSLISFDGLRESVCQLRDKLEDFCKEELKKVSDRGKVLEFHLISKIIATTGPSLYYNQSSADYSHPLHTAANVTPTKGPVYGMNCLPRQQHMYPYQTPHTPPYMEKDEDGLNFEPIVPLPDKVDVKTCEEDEEEMFCKRANLFRFDSDTKKWKERGIGSIKILKHKTSGKVHLLMKGEQDLKICANHYITADMALKPNAGSVKSWVWYAMDYADEIPRTKQLAICFKTADEAALFKVKFEEAQKLLSESPQCQQIKKKCITSEPQVSFKEVYPKTLFSKKEGEWDCDVCCVRNAYTSAVCVACSSAAPSSAKVKPVEEFKGSGPVAPPANLFSIGLSGDSTKNTSSTDVSSNGFTFGSQIPVSCKFRLKEAAVTSAGFGVQADKKTIRTDAPKHKTAALAVPFGTQFSKKEGWWHCNFCLVRNDASATGFRFSFKSILSPSKSPSKLNQSQASVGTDDEQESSQEEQRDDQYFDPVVPLPDLVEVSTGEENEQVLFSHLAKLYCYDKDLSQWKERGIGNLKILQHYKTKRTRLVMRRDQVLKLCANHWIASNMNLEPMKRAEKAWIWNAFDFSEGQGKVEQLAVRFKLQETANAFKEVFEEAKTAQEKDTLLTPFSAFSKPDKRPGAKLGTQTTKTVVSPHKFVFGSDAVQKIFGSPSPSKEKSPVMIPSSKDEKTGASKLKTSGPAVSSQSFSIPTRALLQPHQPGQGWSYRHL